MRCGVAPTWTKAPQIVVNMIQMQLSMEMQMIQMQIVVGMIQMQIVSDRGHDAYRG